MAFVSSEQVRPGGEYLLTILKAEGSVRFSRFYNRDTDYAELAAEAGIAEHDVDHAHVLIEFAAHQLERFGIVSFTALPDELIDGEHDYRIELTETGRKRLAGGEKIGFRTMDV
jgi:hypothetical protein